MVAPFTHKGRAVDPLIYLWQMGQKVIDIPGDPCAAVVAAQRQKMGVQPDMNCLFSRPAHRRYYTIGIDKRQGRYSQQLAYRLIADRRQLIA